MVAALPREKISCFFLSGVDRYASMLEELEIYFSFLTSIELIKKPIARWCQRINTHLSRIKCMYF